MDLRTERLVFFWAVVCLGVLSTAPAAGAQVPRPRLQGVEDRVRDRLTELAKACEARPRDSSTWGLYGMTLDAHGFVDEARQVYRRAHELDRQEFRWPYYLATLADTQEPQAAAGWYETAVALDPEYAPARIRWAQTLETLGRRPEAAAQYSHAVRLDPGNPFGLLGLGRVALEAGKAEEATGHLEAAYRLNPKIQAVVATLAQAYHRTGKRELARERAAEARQLPRVNYRPDQVRADVKNQAIDLRSYLRRAKTYRDVGELADALKELTTVLQLAPDLAEAHFSAAEVHLLRGHPQAAVDAGLKALELDRSLPGLHPFLAGALVQLERFDEARQHATLALEDNPDDTHMLLLLAMAAAEGGQFEALVESTERAFRARPQDDSERGLLIDLLSELGSVFAANGRFQEAGRKMEQILELLAEAGEPPSVVAPYRRRLELYRAGRLDPRLKIQNP